MLNFLIGAAVMYVALYLFGKNAQKKSAHLMVNSVSQHMPYGVLLVTEKLTINDVFYCFLNILQEDVTNGEQKFLDVVTKFDCVCCRDLE